MSYILSIGTANPQTKVSQTTIAEFMAKAMELTEHDVRLLRTIFRASSIQQRYTVVEDYNKTDGFTFYANTSNLNPLPSTKDRMQLYKKYALPLALSAIENCFEKRPEINKNNVSHLITVSCTGMYAPGLDLELVKALSLSSSVERTSINFMGCYAAFNAMKLANAICDKNENASVLIVCLELCSIHFQREATEDNMLANALFGDGCASLIVQAKKQPGFNLKFESFFCDIKNEGENEMAWEIGNLGFEMKLSSYVPTIIESGIASLTASLLKNTMLELKDISFFAIHPGGKRILEVIERQLGLTKEQNKFAYSVLQNFGNMSSPTVLFVLNEVWKSLEKQDNNKRIMSFAFGPGLTLESMILKIEND
jgi:predicted naringenin-chalcone synthase